MLRLSHPGFTLIELMVSIAIVVILALAAFPAYTSFVLRGRLSEATGTLSNLYLDMEQYYQDNRTYLSGSSCGIPAVSTNNFSYACTATATTFTWTATSNTNLGASGDYVFTMDQDGNRKTASYQGTDYSPAKNCWLLKGNEC